MKLAISVNKFLVGATFSFCISGTAVGQQNPPLAPVPSGNASVQSGSPEQSPDEQSFKLEVHSNLVLVRVVVRGKDGEPVRGLKKEDFRLFDKGKEQTISEFEEVPSASPAALSPAHSTTTARQAVSAGSATGSEQRFIAFYFDEFNSSEADLVQARDAADHYLATSLGPNDHVAIFTAEKVLCDFTSDPHKIHDALMQLHASTRGPAKEHLCPDLSDYQAYQILETDNLDSDAWRVAIAEAETCPAKAFAPPSNIDPGKPNPASLQPIRMLAQRIVDQAQGLARANLQQFERVVESIAKAPGQRSVVLVSPGFLSQSEQYTLDRIIDHALRDQVVINSLDPKGLALLMRESNASANTRILPDPRASVARYHLDASKQFVGADVLAEVAEGTGGEFFHSDNDLKAGFAALTGDPPHYILAFSPENVKWDGKFHPLKITFSTKEKGRVIQARRGYFAVQSPTSPKPVDAANNEPHSPPTSGSAEKTPTPPVPSQLEVATAPDIPPPPVAGPGLGPSIADSADAEDHNPKDLIPPSDVVRPILPNTAFVIPENASRDIKMPDPSQGLIRVDVRVTDKAGKPVSGLSEKDFRLLDDDQPRKIVTLRQFDGAVAQPTDSHEVILVIDELNMVTNDAKIAHLKKPDAIDESMANERLAFASAIGEVKTLLRANGGALQEPTMVYRLTLDGLFATPHPSIDGNELAREIENPAMQRRIWSTSEISKDIQDIAKGGGASWRISHSLVALGSMAIEERRRPGRKLMFWIGNGWQIEGRRATGLAEFSIELLTRMREARINLWGASEWPLFDGLGNAIPVTDYSHKEFLEGAKPDSIDLGYLSLPVIAARSGGGMLAVPRDLAARIRERVKEEGNYYSLTFDPPQTSAIDEYHHLRLQIEKRDLTAHLFQDYYDEPVFFDQPPAKQPITAKQLEDMAAKANDTAGTDLARQFDGMQLTERLSNAKLAIIEKQVRGGKAREALEAMAAEAIFLAPPADEIPSTPPPDIAAQRQMVGRMVSYINNAIPSLPNLFATRTTVQYHEPQMRPGETWKTALPDQSLQEGETATASIHFHDGKEHVEAISLKRAPDKPGSERLETVGAFGPILATVMVAATSPHGEMKWSRWEKNGSGQLAVFRYRVPEATSLFIAEFCCLAYDFDAVPFKQPAPFHGEITVDPASGAIMRLTIQADLAWRLPLERSDVMVEYAPIMRGSRTFICPLRSVSVSRQRRDVSIDEWGEGFRVYGPFETLLNEMRFEKFRIFGSTFRILPDFTEVPGQK